MFQWVIARIFYLASSIVLGLFGCEIFSNFVCGRILGIEQVREGETRHNIFTGCSVFMHVMTAFGCVILSLLVFEFGFMEHKLTWPM